MSAVVHHGDCLEVMASMPADSVDAIVTDPPYGLGFMGKAWDELPPGLDWARECLRVLKPGGHLLAFGGTRTWHRLAVAVEDAGFEIRDSIAWLYGSGFPKSMDVSKAIDKIDAAEERRARALEFTAFIRRSGLTSARIDEITGTNMGGHFTTAASQPAIATADLFDVLRPYLGEVPARIEELVAQRTVESQNFKAREVVGKSTNGIAGGTGQHAGEAGAYGFGAEFNITAPSTPAAQKWQGWGTALKPAFEPVVVARKPLIGTVAANVLSYGVGALNIDASRIGTTREVPASHSKSASSIGAFSGATVKRDPSELDPNIGRFPANVILDSSQAAALDQQSGVLTSNSKPGQVRRSKPHASTSMAGSLGGDGNLGAFYGDSGGASRFFYVAKAPKKERPVVDGTAHPTVKPLALMRYLCRLVTPVGGTILDPFAGSGTTLEAATLEGFHVIGIEREADYLPLIQARLDRAA